MKLFRYGERNKERPGVVLPNGQRIDVSDFGEDFGEEFLGSDGITRLAAWVKNHGANAPKVGNDVRLGPPIRRPSKIICVGLNYKDHAKETGAEVPKEPVLFMKATSSIVGPNDALVIPRRSEQTDWEVEIAVVIGKRASYVEEKDAAKHIAGYMLHNDYSEREFQLKRGGQWSKGKSCDTFAPMGPYLVSSDEFTDPQNRRMWLKVNGTMMQDSSTSEMIFHIPHLVSYISQFMSLLPGDVISTGTPAGVALGMKEPRFIRPGDVIELGIEGLGESKQEAIAAE